MNPEWLIEQIRKAAQETTRRGGSDIALVALANQIEDTLRQEQADRLNALYKTGSTDGLHHS